MEPHADAAGRAPERRVETQAGVPRPVVWPWLVVPAVTLGVFFALRSCQQGAMRAPPDAMPEAPTLPQASPPPPSAPLRPAG